MAELVRFPLKFIGCLLKLARFPFNLLYYLDRYSLQEGDSKICSTSVIRDIQIAIEGLTYVYTLLDSSAGKAEVLSTPY